MPVLEQMRATHDATSLTPYAIAVAAFDEAHRAFDEAGDDYARLAHREAELEAYRPHAKLDAIKRLMRGLNELSAGKQHSASSAEAIVETDHQYFAHLTEQRDVVLQKNHARDRRESARLRMELMVVVAKVEGGLR